MFGGSNTHSEGIWIKRDIVCPMFQRGGGGWWMSRGLLPFASSSELSGLRTKGVSGLTKKRHASWGGEINYHEIPRYEENMTGIKNHKTNLRMLLIRWYKTASRERERECIKCKCMFECINAWSAINIKKPPKTYPESQFAADTLTS